MTPHARRRHVLASLACAAACAGQAVASRADDADADAATGIVSRAPRGSSGSLEITYEAAPLRAKATSDLSAPVLVRVSTLAPGRHRIEYMGLVSGTYDLSAYVEQADGRAAAFATPLTVEVFTQLPPGHGSDVFGLSAPSFGLRGGYREILIGLAALWTLVPAVAIGVRLARRRPASAAAPAARGPSLAERLREIVAEARARELSLDERARLELLLLQALRAHAGRPGDSPSSLAAAIASMREDPEHGAAVRAVERWLHARNPGEARAALDAIDALPAAGPRRPAEEVAR